MSNREGFGRSLLLAAGLAIHSLFVATSLAGQTIDRPALARSMDARITPVEQEYQKLLALEESLAKEVAKWMDRSEETARRHDTTDAAEPDREIELRLQTVRDAYITFLRGHPKYAEARIGFGSFLFRNGEEEAAVKQWERATKLNPQNPDAWNYLAHYYQHRGPVKKAFRYYGKAIHLNPREPVFLQNLAGAVYVFRKDAMEYYRIPERAVFEKALQLYRQALKLDPKNFQLATELAESYYLIKPLPTREALQAWNDALATAENDFQRESVYLHMARVEMKSGLFDEARHHLDAVTNALHQPVKGPLVRTLQNKVAQSARAR